MIVTENVLIVDTTIPEATATILSVSDKSVEIIERKSLLLPFLDLCQPIVDNDQESVIEYKKNLKDLLSQITSNYSGSLLIIPPVEYLSLNLNLPFTDKKRLAKLIDLEVQDIIPFDIDDFLVDYKPTGLSSDLGNDIHVSAVKKELIVNLVDICKEIGFEPHCITPPSPALYGIIGLFPEYKAKNIVFVLAFGEWIHILFCISGKAVTDRVISQNNKSISQELLQFIHRIESSYKVQLEELVLLETLNNSSLLDIEALKESAHWNITNIRLATEVSDKSSEINTVRGNNDAEQNRILHDSLAVISSQIVTEVPISPSFVNFRTRQFAFYPKLKQIINAAFSIVPLLLITCLACIICSLIIYYLRSNQITQYRTTLKERITSVVPDLSAPEGLEVDTLKNEIKRLDQQLKELGSTSILSPVQSFSEISKDLPSGTNLVLKKINIQTNRIFIEGTAPDYTAVEKIERLLKRKKEFYCKIKKDTSSNSIGQTDKRSFSFEILICDN